jgi:hypothetical protein
MKFTFGMVLIIVLALIVASTLSFFWLVLTPHWSFTIVTNKPSYTSTENIQITVTLKNVGYITQTITSGFSDPVGVWIEWTSADYSGENPDVWDSSRPPYGIHIANTTFTILPDKTLTRTFEFDQSLLESSYRSKPYMLRINAAIPKTDRYATSDIIETEYQLFYAYARVNVTSQ